MYRWTQAVYALHGVPSIVAVVINYARRGDVAGTWLASHFRWQIRTYWFCLLWAGVCGAVVVLGGLRFGWFPFGFVAAWFIYRIARGWIALCAKRLMYA